MGHIPPAVMFLHNYMTPLSLNYFHLFLSTQCRELNNLKQYITANVEVFHKKVKLYGRKFLKNLVLLRRICGVMYERPTSKVGFKSYGQC